MLQIRQAQLCHMMRIAQFQLEMALETEKLELDKVTVQQAVKYIMDHREYGFYIVPVDSKEPQNACGSLLITYENAQSWWIQSVYVKKQYRRQGVFTRMFKTVIEKAKEKGVKSVQLYVQKQNNRAKQTYKKLGMECNGNEFYGFDLLHGDATIIKYLSSQSPQNAKVIPRGETGNIGMSPISGKMSGKNKMISVVEGETELGFCEYFYQFSDWRFGMIIYLSAINSRPEWVNKVIQSAACYVFETCHMKVGAIRIIYRAPEIVRLKQAIPTMHEDVYDVMQIKL